MWKTIFQRINAKNPSGNESRIDNKQLMRLAIVEMEQSIFNSTEALTLAIGNQRKIELQVQEFAKEAELWKERVEEALYNGIDEAGKNALEKQKLAETFALQYLELAENSNTTVKNLRLQLESLKIKLSEAKAGEAIHSVQNSGDQLSTTLETIGLNQQNTFVEDFEKLEQTINIEEDSLKKISENTPNEKIILAEPTVSNATSTDFEAMKKAFFGETKQENKSISNEINKKITTFFNNNTLETNTTEKNKLVASFFDENSSKKSTSNEKQKKLDDFFNANN